MRDTYFREMKRNNIPLGAVTMTSMQKFRWQWLSTFLGGHSLQRMYGPILTYYIPRQISFYTIFGFDSNRRASKHATEHVHIQTNHWSRFPGILPAENSATPLQNYAHLCPFHLNEKENRHNCMWKTTKREVSPGIAFSLVTLCGPRVSRGRRMMTYPETGWWRNALRVPMPSLLRNVTARVTTSIGVDFGLTRSSSYQGGGRTWRHQNFEYQCNSM